MPGPLPTPDGHRRRRNAPTIPTTALPVSGRTGPIPKVPKWIELGKSGTAWWRWAWKTPQAAAWGPGHEVMVARRAELEDDLATIAAVDSLDLADVLGEDDARAFKAVITHLASLVTGRLAIQKEMLQLEDRLGLTPKAQAALRWVIVPDETPDEAPAARRRTERRLRAVDASAATG